VSDQETILEMSLIWTRTKLVVEPSLALTVAVVLRNPGLFEGERMGLLFPGGNVDLTDLPF
jgi:threonine dehydratase